MGKSFTALVVGGTGATGSYLIKQLLQNPDVTKITSLGRRKLPFIEESGDNLKLKEIVVDMDKLDTIKDEIEPHDAAFCCLGTTRKDAGSVEAFRKIDSDYVVSFAKLAKEKSIPVFNHVSAIWANANSWFFLLRVKGETEQKLKELEFPRLNIFQPGLLERNEYARPLEKLGKWVMPSVSVVVVAKAMIEMTLDQLSEEEMNESQTKVVSNSEMKKLFQAA